MRRNKLNGSNKNSKSNWNFKTNNNSNNMTIIVEEEEGILAQLKVRNIATSKLNKTSKRKVLVIGDIHEPFSHDEYLKFCKEQYDKFNCDTVVFIGDIIDNHFSSFHPTDPDGYGAGEELERAINKIQKWYKAFPNAYVTIGNHDCYDEETEILTENGFIKGIELKEGVKVGTLNINTNQVEYQLPNTIINKEYIGDMIKYGIDSNYIDMLVTPGHRMLFQEKENSISDTNYKLEEAFKLNKGYKYFPLSGSNPNTVDYDLSDEEIKLLAWIASDGSIKENSFVIYQSKINTTIEIENLLKNLNIDYTKKTRKRDIKKICERELITEPLEENSFYFKYDKLKDIYKNKYILPKELNKLTKRQFELFIETYIDGDGSRKYNIDGTSKKGSVIYGTKEMLEQLQTLCLQNNYSTDLVKYRKKDYKLNIVKDKKNAGLQLNDECTIVDYNGKVWCVEVPNSTVITRRNGRVNISGNCLVRRKAFASGITKHWVRDYDEVLNTPNWKFVDKIIIDNVLYIHGEGGTARSKAKEVNNSVVQGHLHSQAYVEFINNGKFAMQVGTGIDESKYAFAYNKAGKESIISCGVILEGTQPILIKF